MLQFFFAIGTLDDTDFANTIILKHRNCGVSYSCLLHSASTSCRYYNCASRTIIVQTNYGNEVAFCCKTWDDFYTVKLALDCNEIRNNLFG